VLAGRVAELRELHGAAVRAAAERRGWVGLIGGEPGIGKTRLAAACAAGLAEDGFGCAWVTCPEENGAPPFWVWGQLLGQLGAGDVLRPGAGEADPEVARFLLFEEVATRIREAAASRSLLLVVDDLHWADPGSRRLLAAIRGALATLPVVALCTYRDTEPTADALCAEVGPERHLVLGGLAPGELAIAVRLATGSAVPDALLDGLHARTAGNPYFAAEAVRYFAPKAGWTPLPSCRPSCYRAPSGPCWSGDWPGCRPRPPSCCGWPRYSVTSSVRRCSRRQPGSRLRRWRPRWRRPRQPG